MHLQWDGMGCEGKERNDMGCEGMQGDMMRRDVLVGDVTGSIPIGYYMSVSGLCYCVFHEIINLTLQGMLYPPSHPCIHSSTHLGVHNTHFICHPHPNTQHTLTYTHTICNKLTPEVVVEDVKDKDKITHK